MINGGRLHWIEHLGCYDIEPAHAIRTLDSGGLEVGLRDLYNSPDDRIRVWPALVSALR